MPLRASTPLSAKQAPDSVPTTIHSKGAPPLPCAAFVRKSALFDVIRGSRLRIDLVFKPDERPRRLEDGLTSPGRENRANRQHYPSGIRDRARDKADYQTNGSSLRVGRSTL